MNVGETWDKRRRLQVTPEGPARDRRDLPVALATTVLLGLVGVFVDMARLGEVARKVLVRVSGAIGQASMVAVSVLVGASHCSKISIQLIR